MYLHTVLYAAYSEADPPRWRVCGACTAYGHLHTSGSPSAFPRSTPGAASTTAAPPLTLIRNCNTSTSLVANWPRGSSRCA